MYRLTTGIELQLKKFAETSDNDKVEISGHIDEKGIIKTHNFGDQISTHLNLTRDQDMYFHTHPSMPELGCNIISKLIPPSSDDIVNILICHREYGQTAEAIACPYGYWMVIPKVKIIDDLLLNDLLHMYFVIVSNIFMYEEPEKKDLENHIDIFCKICETIDANIIPDINNINGMFFLKKCMNYINPWQARCVYMEYHKKLQTLHGMKFIDLHFYQW